MKRRSFDEVVADLKSADQEDLTNEMIDFILEKISEYDDFDGIFEPA